MIFKEHKRLILSISILLLGLMFVGCSGDSGELSSGDGIIESVTGPDFVIKGDSGADSFSVSTIADNPTYQWIVEDESLADFTNPTNKESYLEPTLEGINAGK
jgi:hypothetical protein